MIITDEQIRQLALYIVYDVRQYVQEHQKEYEEFIEHETIDDQESSESQTQKGMILNANDTQTPKGNKGLED